MWGFEATSTTASRKPRRPSLGWASLTTSSRATPCCAFPMRERSSLRSMRTSCFREISRRGWRVHLEVHAQRLRFQHPGRDADYVSDRVEQFEDSRLRDSRECSELPWADGARSDVQRGRAILYASNRRRRCGSHHVGRAYTVSH